MTSTPIKPGTSRSDLLDVHFIQQMEESGDKDKDAMNDILGDIAQDNPIQLTITVGSDKNVASGSNEEVNKTKNNEAPLDLSVFPSALHPLLLESDRLAEKEKHKYFYVCATQKLCLSSQEALLKHWEYPVYRFGDQRSDHMIGEKYLDTPLCPPPYVMITRAAFNGELARKAPLALDSHLVKTVTNLDKFGSFKKKILNFLGVFSLIELMRLHVLDKLDNVQKFDKMKRHLRHTILAGRFLAEMSNVDPNRNEYGFVAGHGLDDFRAAQIGLNNIEPDMYNLMLFSYNKTAAFSTGYPFELVFEGAHKNRYDIPIVYFHVNRRIDYFGLKKYCKEAAKKFELFQVCLAFDIYINYILDSNKNY